MPTTLPVRRPLSAESRDLAARLADIERLVRAARVDPEVRMRTLLRARVGLWLIRRHVRRLADRFPDEQD